MSNRKLELLASRHNIRLEPNVANVMQSNATNIPNVEFSETKMLNIDNQTMGNTPYPSALATLANVSSRPTPSVIVNSSAYIPHTDIIDKP